MYKTAKFLIAQKRIINFARLRGHFPLWQPCIKHPCSQTANIHTCHKTFKQFILGIESSCDDTGAAVVDEDGVIMGEALNSQLCLHQRMGGVSVEIASWSHAKNVQLVVSEAMKAANVSYEDLTAVATTIKPGMKLCLIVGTNYGKKISLKYNKPFIPIHHMEAHALTVRMIEQVDFPYLVVLVSGGHCIVAVAHSLDRWSIIGQSIDIAPGRAFDRITRRMKLRNLDEFSKSISGGQIIEKLADRGNKTAYVYKQPLSRFGHASFSFAGSQSRTEEIITRSEKENAIEGGNVTPNAADICASFQHCVVSHIVRQTQRAMVYCHMKELIPSDKATLVVSGGVACNKYLQECFQKLCTLQDYKLLFPPPHLCTDNGVMVAWNGMERWKANCGVLHDQEDISNVEVNHKCSLGPDLTTDVQASGIKMSGKWIKL